jgi:hypothetical protein
MKLEQLKELPLWVAHYDLNEVNVLIDEDCNVTGLVQLVPKGPFRIFKFLWYTKLPATVFASICMNTTETNMVCQQKSTGS